MKTKIRIRRVYDAPGPGGRQADPRGSALAAGAHKGESENRLLGQGHRALQRTEEMVRPRSCEVGRIPKALLRRARPEQNGVEALIEAMDKGPVSFVYGSTERTINNAEALKLYMERRT